VGWATAFTDWKAPVSGCQPVTYDSGSSGETPFLLDGELVRGGIPLKAQLTILLKLQPSGGCEGPQDGAGTVSLVAWGYRGTAYPGNSQASLLPTGTPIYPCEVVWLVAVTTGTPYCWPGAPDPGITPPMPTEFEITGTIIGTYHRTGTHLTVELVTTLKFCPRTWYPSPAHGDYNVDCTVPPDPPQPVVIDGTLGTPDARPYNRGVGPSVDVGNYLGSWRYGS
jgi:hypothetical protein